MNQDNEQESDNFSKLERFEYNLNRAIIWRDHLKPDPQYEGSIEYCILFELINYIKYLKNETHNIRTKSNT